MHASLRSTPRRTPPTGERPDRAASRWSRRVPAAIAFCAVVVLGTLAGIPVRPVTPLPETRSGMASVFPALELSGAGSVVRESGPVSFGMSALSALNATWRQDLPAGTSFALEVRSGGEPWRTLHPDHDALVARDDDPLLAWEPEPESAETVSEMVVARGNAVEFRATLSSTGPAASVRDVSALAFSAPSGRRSTSAYRSATAAEQVRIITREEWGADESLRLFNENNPTPQIKGKSNSDISARAVEELGDEIAIAKTVDADGQGQPYTWPMETSKVIKKIVLHHTAGAQPLTPDEAVSYIRSIYFFHTITRGWGDIGYNYIVDPFGNVYEGRAGGPGVVGAHAANFNIGSIGISVLGSYENVDITPESKRALVALIHQLSKEHDIDPNGSGIFRLQDMPNVVGHRDVGQTDCPGSILWTELPDIRSMAAEDLVMPEDPRWLPTLLPKRTIPDSRRLPDLPDRTDATEIVELSSRLDELDATVQGVELRAASLRPDPENPHALSLAPGDSASVTLRFINEGSATLTALTYLHADVVPRYITIGEQEETTIAARLPDGSAVARGEVAEFTFPLSIDLRARGRFELQFTPVANAVHSLPVAAVRLRIDVTDPGLVRQVTGVALDVQQRVLSSIVPPDVRQEKASVPVRDSIALAADSDAESMPFLPVATVSTLPERFRPILPTRVQTEPTELVGLDATERPIRVRLAHAPSDELTLSASTSLRVQTDGATWSAPALSMSVTATAKDGMVQLSAGDERASAQIVRLSASASGLVQLPSWKRRGDQSANPDDTSFRGTIELRAEGATLIVINELPLEEYLYGLAEPSPNDPPEKIKALVIVARSYAQYYRDASRKFAGAPYDLDDDPAVSQKYLGATFEQRAPALRAAVDATRGQVITYQGRLVKTPYFTSSLGQTKSAEEVWGWTQTPYLTPVTDPCDAPRAAGHGVGLSGCGARVLAENGATAEQILKHFYTGVDISPRSDT